MALVASPLRLLCAAAFAAALGAAHAQQPDATTPALEVQRLAPQLVTFLGSEANFQSLINGPVGGTLPTTLGTTPLGGVLQGQTGTVLNVSDATSPPSPAATLQGRMFPGTASTDGLATGNTSDSRFPRGVSDTPPAPLPGTTLPPAPVAAPIAVTPAPQLQNRPRPGAQ